jgi:hypothetical protein
MVKDFGEAISPKPEYSGDGPWRPCADHRRNRNGSSLVRIRATRFISKMAEKGEKIRFVKGRYQNLTGWKDKSYKKKRGSNYRGVIVKFEDGSQKVTRVKKSSFRPSHEDAVCFEQAAMQQNPDMEHAMIRFAEMWVECHINSNDKAVEYLHYEIERARLRQKELGSKARYRKVEFTAPTVIMSGA